MIDFDAIRRTHPIASIVGQAIKLEKAGREYRAICPFHAEKTPSFHVVPAKEFAHCHGCGWHGDVVDFVAAYKGISQGDAIDMLTDGDALTEVSDEEQAVREEALRLREEAALAARQVAIAEACAIWEGASPADPHHPYLARKGVEPHTARQTDSALVLPIYGPQTDAGIQSIQTIDDTGGKKFHYGAPVSLGRMHIGIFMGRTILCEGFATGATIYDAIPDQVCVTFSLGNMEKIAREYHAAGKSFILASDTGNAATKMVKLAEELGVPVVIPRSDIPDDGTDFNDQARAFGIADVSAAFRQALKAFADNQAVKGSAPEIEAGPIDLWAKPLAPLLPKGVLPSIIERFAFGSAEQIGADPAGLAMSAIASCAAVISDEIKVKPKQHEEWREAARLWVMLIGPPSARKTPCMARATSRIKKMDSAMLHEANRALADWQEDGGRTSGKPKPPMPRLRIGDSTTEAAQEVCKESPDGVMMIQDELSGLFGRIDKYGGKGGGADRSFWLEAYGGGQYAVNRIGRGSFLIENLSITILGGIQPEKIKSVIDGADDDGMIQRFIPVVLRPAAREKDAPAPPVAEEFGDIIELLHALKPPENFFGKRPLVLSDEARAIREELIDEHRHFVEVLEGINSKFSTHVGKYDGLFPRLCVVWHCVEHVANTSASSNEMPDTITGETAARVAKFMREYILGHARVFYGSIGNVEVHDEIVRAIGGWILAHNIERFTLRDLTRNVRQFRAADDTAQERAVRVLESYGWADPDPKKLQHPAWDVPAEVHQKYVQKAEAERVRRADARQLIQIEVKGDGDAD